MKSKNNIIHLVEFQGISVVKSVSKSLRTLPCERHMCFFRLVTFTWHTIIYHFSNKEKAQQQKTKQKTK